MSALPVPIYIQPSPPPAVGRVLYRIATLLRASDAVLPPGAIPATVLTPAGGVTPFAWLVRAEHDADAPPLSPPRPRAVDGIPWIADDPAEDRRAARVRLCLGVLEPRFAERRVTRRFDAATRWQAAEYVEAAARQAGVASPREAAERFWHDIVGIARVWRRPEYRGLPFAAATARWRYEDRRERGLAARAHPASAPATTAPASSRPVARQR